MMTSSAPTRARVLFVDDEPRVLHTMRMLFRTHYEVYFAECGSQALELLRQKSMNVIVSDQRMPGMTGIELLREAREVNPNAMRILLTGYSDLTAIIGSVNEGEIFRFVNKPWNNQELTSTVAQAVVASRIAALPPAPEPAPMEPVVAELVAEAEALPAGAGVLVMDDDPRLPRQIQSILGARCQVYGALTMDRAVGLLERERIGVVVSNTRVQGHPVVGLIGTLKQHQPELVSVILTERADASAAIELINQGQIYRFITKPMVENTCKIMIQSALKQHERLAQQPELHRRYEVAPTPMPPPTSTSGRLLDRIRSLKSWIAGRH
jgi:DNA-binding NtrC family response regulator